MYKTWHRLDRNLFYIFSKTCTPLLAILNKLVRSYLSLSMEQIITSSCTHAFNNHFHHTIPCSIRFFRPPISVFWLCNFVPSKSFGTKVFGQWEHSVWKVKPKCIIEMKMCLNAKANSSIKHLQKMLSVPLSAIDKDKWYLIVPLLLLRLMWFKSLFPTIYVYLYCAQ